ncbi:MAG: hypothetical protein OIF54_17760, partial [Cohaesibacter sp.]|nr:hypothetical protein [Cohaesibacter sp.]
FFFRPFGRTAAGRGRCSEYPTNHHQVQYRNLQGFPLGMMMSFCHIICFFLGVCEYAGDTLCIFVGKLDLKLDPMLKSQFNSEP